MMKPIFFLFLIIFSNVSLFAQLNEEYPGIPLTVGVDSDVWNSGLLQRREDNITRILHQGEVVMGNTQSTDSQIKGQTDRLTRVWFEGEEYVILTRNLIPMRGSKLPSDWITTLGAEKRWVASYYLNVLRSRERDTFIDFEQVWFNWLPELYEYSGVDYDWYERNINYESLVLFDAVIFMGGFFRSIFFINNITPLNAGYRITMSGDSLFARNEMLYPRVPPISLPFPFPLWEERQSFDMIFIPDGDFMDVYLDSFENHFATFAKVDAVVLEELERLVRTNTVDLSKITSWPRRADGSMDIPPPAIEVDPVSEVAEQSVTAPVEVADIAATEALPVATENTPATGTLPLWTWLAIGGGALAVLGGMFAVRRKQRKERRISP